MKKLLNLLLLMLGISSYSQGISPDENSEFCPNQNYYLYASIQGSYQSMTAAGSANIV